MPKQDRVNYQQALVDLIGSRPIAYWPALARKVGGVKAAIMLGQLLYWSGDKSAQKRDGWFYKSVNEFELETGLNKVEQQSARKKLVALGLIEAELRGLHPVWWYRVFVDQLGEFLIRWETHRMRNSSDEKLTDHRVRNPPDDRVRNPPDGSSTVNMYLNTETTYTKTTTKTTSSSSQPSSNGHEPTHEEEEEDFWPFNLILENAGINPDQLPAEKQARFLAWWLYALCHERISLPVQFALSRLDKAPETAYQELAAYGPCELYSQLFEYDRELGLKHNQLVAIRKSGLRELIDNWYPLESEQEENG
jgi:hypothetical protein